MLKKYLKRKVIAALTALCVLSMTACGGEKEEKGAGNSVDGVSDNVSGNLEMGIYTFEEKVINQGTENQESYMSNFFLKGNELYYLYYMYPEYPEEYYEDLKKLDEEMGDNDTGVMPLKGDSDDKAADSPSEDDSGSSDTASKDKPASDNPDDVSDDELTGDIDDLFGDGKPDDAAATDKPEDGAKPDDASGSDIKTYEDLEEKYKDYKTTKKMCKYNLETEEVTDVFDYSEDEYMSISAYCVDDENRIVMLQEVYDEENMKSDGGDSNVYSIVVKDAEGKDVSNTDITDKIRGDANSGSSSDFYISENKFGPDGYLYVSYVQGEMNKTTISRIKSDGTLDGKVTAEEYVDSMAIDNNGRVAISSFKDDKYVYSYLDFDKEAIGEQLEGFEEDNSYGNIMSGYGDITFFIKDSKALYKYSSESKEKTMILNWLDSGLVGDNVNSIIPLGDGRLFCMYSDDMGGNKTGILTKSAESGTEKKVIKLGSTYVNSTLQELIIAFNKTNSEYKIEYVSYEDQENPDTAFANDIIAGNIPDIISISSVDVNNFVNKGILEDLTPYMEKDDTVNKDYFVDGVLDATAIDGKNYYLVKEFAIRTIAGKASDLKDYKDGWTVQEMIDYYNSKPEGTELMESATKSGVFYELICSDIGNYIDWKTGEVKFDSDEFKKVLEFCNKFPKEIDEDADLESHKKIKEGKLLLNTMYLTELANLQLYGQLFDNDVQYIGYPTSDKNGTYLTATNEALAMTTSSENKDVVWEFIKFVMTQKDKYWSGIPAAKVYFEDMVKQKTTTEEYVDEDGETVRPVDETYGWNDFEVKIKPSSQEDVQLLRDLIKKSRAISDSYDINTLIEEEVNKYFEGSKTLDDIVKIIQDKISKYVNENK